MMLHKKPTGKHESICGKDEAFLKEGGIDAIV